ncbi:hypothetical protein MS3_00000409 [Schistosoma haematobium]|uniref:Uncharacterized protein n=1 Tax=Schistosoma haematobium TaxID=6185 RepID=A0A922INT3_SCHHA|nr:hypothetical protein MS3_00000409 [Schistosoma haematobium]KAH9582850.1 hypothetical protein MS3_00000409 [Schistosoma haematobium]
MQRLTGKIVITPKITDSALNDNKFKPRKPSPVCSTTFDFLQSTNQLRQTTNLGNKRLENGTYTSGIKSTSNHKRPHGCTHRPDSLLCPTPKMLIIPLSDVMINDNQ